MTITDMAGKPWVFPNSYAKHSNVRVYIGVLRGGARTVSSTEEYNPDPASSSDAPAEQQQEPQEVDMQDPDDTDIAHQIDVEV